MNNFINWLEEHNKSNSKVRAVLRRSLAFDPGTFVAAYPYVEPFLKGDDGSWRRQMYYLVAGLWAVHWREGRRSESMSLGKACAAYRDSKDSQSVERRFITLLDSDQDQLAHRLRQMITLLKEYPIDFEQLLNGLTYWNDDQKRTQAAWARDFYRNPDHKIETHPSIQEEKTR